MKVEIWSDIMCPFCYIGKRRFEQALKGFPHKEDVEVVWKSFQLDPGIRSEAGKNVNQYLAERKGITLDEARAMNDRVTVMAKELGLNYDFDRAVVANSFDAHRLLQLAKQSGKGNEMEEALFNAYFTEGRNIADRQILLELAAQVGLDKSAAKEVFDSNEYASEVEGDIYEARQIGVSGVPYFVLNDRYAVTGAQAVETFAGALDKAYGEWEKENQHAAS